MKQFDEETVKKLIQKIQNKEKELTRIAPQKDPIRTKELAEYKMEYKEATGEEYVHQVKLSATHMCLLNAKKRTSSKEEEPSCAIKGDSLSM